LVPLILALTLQNSPQTPSGASVSYRLLNLQILPPDDARSYVVSVEKPLDVPALKALVCQIIRTEKPPNTRVEIGIYLGLDEFIPSLGSKPLSDKLAAHRMAAYRWNVKLPKDRQRLTVMKDSEGKALTKWRFYDFDHGTCATGGDY
jgi:hypothetical protein